MATLKERLNDLAKAIAANFLAQDKRITSLSILVNGGEKDNAGLITVVKENLVQAINEVFRMARTNALAITDLTKLVQEGGMGSSVKTYAAYPDKNITVMDTASLILPGDQYRENIGFQCETHDLAICWQPGKDAAFDGTSQSKIIYAGSFEVLDGMGTGAISGIARAPDGEESAVQYPAIINMTVIGRTTDKFPLPQKLTGDRKIAALPDSGTDVRLLDALRVFFNDMDDSDVPASNTLNALSSMILPGHSPANGVIDLINPGLGPYELKNGASGQVIHVPYSHWAGNGLDQFISTRRTSGDLKFTLESHGLIVKTKGDVIQNDGFICGSSPNYYVNSSRSGIIAGLRDGGGLETVDAVPGDWLGINRKSADGFDGWVNETKKSFTRPFGSNVPGTTFNWLATNGGSAGFSAPSRQKLEIGVTFRGLIADATYLKVLRGLQKVNAVQQAIALERA